MGSLAVLRLDASTGELAGRSQRWQQVSDAPDAVLVAGVPTDDAILLGAFQRTSEVSGDRAMYRRGSGGAAARIGRGTIWLQLALSRADALVPCTPDKLLNRYVRPLLRALTRASSVPASYFGRDWISAAHRPVALVSFAHEARSGRALVEALVAVQTPFAVGDRPSFLGKAPATLEEVAGRSLEPARVAELIVDAYRGLAATACEIEPAVVPCADEASSEAPWRATVEEAIGTLAAGPDASGRLRVGGELMASLDAVERLEELLATLAPDASADAIGRVVDDALASSGAVVFGVRSFASLRDVILRARTA